jgi:hypothetical protein
MIAACFSGCYYVAPEGYSRLHHTYGEALAFARKIDSNAAVEKDSDVYTLDQYENEHREGDAVINGIACHVASSERHVYNLEFAAGEFARAYYTLATDYDYCLAKSILAEKQPDWSMSGPHTSGYRGNYNGIYTDGIIDLPLSQAKPLSDAELERIWQEAYEIDTEYQKNSIKATLFFLVSVPAVRTQGNQRIVMSEKSFFTEDSKQDFIEAYHKAWALMESGLPISDEDTTKY